MTSKNGAHPEERRVVVVVELIDKVKLQIRASKAGMIRESGIYMRRLKRQNSPPELHNKHCLSKVVRHSPAIDAEAKQDCENLPMGIRRTLNRLCKRWKG